MSPGAGCRIELVKQSGEIAIVDYGLGNLFSVKQACEQVGISANITGAGEEIIAADGIILPGVGAFRDAMQALNARDLVNPVHEVIASGKPVIGICLGMQLLMTESHEFGHNPGLGVIDGTVVRFDNDIEAGGDRLKVPQVGWNKIRKMHAEDGGGAGNGSIFSDIDDGAYMYFVHSFYTIPADPDIVLTTTRYGDIDFCSSLSLDNIFACQFHPERSGVDGLKIYKNLRKLFRE